MRSDIVPGGTFPDYELPDHTSTLRRLSDLQGDDPLILTLARPLLPEGAPAASRPKFLCYLDSILLIRQGIGTESISSYWQQRE